MMHFVVDPDAGMCPGVKRAIRMAEEGLKEGPLCSLGPLIHNPAEVDRLQQQGLVTLDQDQVERDGTWESLRSRRILIRSHGVSPQTESRVRQAAREVLDATCPRVRHLQHRVAKAAAQGCQVLIFGKKGHPEVRGLLGYCLDQGMAIEDGTDLNTVTLHVPAVLISQTTMPEDRFRAVAHALKQRSVGIEVQETLCRAILHRQSRIQEFARSVDVVLVIGGRSSSNTGVFYRQCVQVNSASYHIESSSEVQPQWFDHAGRIGLTGGASTPLWQIEAIRSELENTVPKGTLNTQ